MPLVEYLLPDFLLSYYQLTRVEKVPELLHLYLEEKNYPESDTAKQHLVSKGFLPEITIQDFLAAINVYSCTSNAVVGSIPKQIK